jgi:hypothetical protein
MAEGSWIRINAVDAHLDATTVNSIIEKVLGKRAVSITQKPEVRQRIGEEFIRVVTPFVPNKSGALRASGRATDDGRLYWTAVAPARGEEGYAFNYAETVYDPNSTRWPDGEYKKPTTQDTYPRWVTRVTDDPTEWAVFVNSITPIIKEAFADDE